LLTTSHIDLRAAQVHVIFQLPSRLRNFKGAPDHLAYVEWFNPFRAPDPIHGLRPVSRSLRGGNPVAEVIPLTDIVQSCHLVPAYGRKAARIWRQDVMNQCKDFYFNHWFDLRTFVLHKQC
jgi:hypothetical protein